MLSHSILVSFIDQLNKLNESEKALLVLNDLRVLKPEFSNLYAKYEELIHNKKEITKKETKPLKIGDTYIFK